MSAYPGYDLNQDEQKANIRDMTLNRKKKI